MKGDGILVCPSSQDEERDRVFFIADRPQFTYAINNVYWSDAANALFEKSRIRTLAQIEDSAGTVFCGDSTRDQTISTSRNWGFQVTGDTFFPDTTPPTLGTSVRQQGLFVARHNGGLNFTFFDGHAKWLKLEKMNEKNTAGDRLRHFTPGLD
jgi:prepilin-type processing-associated H-X9-DG protein